MLLSEVPVTDVRAALTAQRERLLDLLGALDDAQWSAPTAAPGWSVKDIALHLLDVDLRWVARDRDRELGGLIPMDAGHAELVRGLGELNQRWVEAARMLSGRLITGLLRWSGEQLDAHLATADLTRPGFVYWAGAAPLWFDLARELTERWVHYRQVQSATGAAGPASGAPDEYLPLVLRTFIWGFPHQYAAPAPAGTTVAVEIAGDGALSWTLTRAADGWSLSEGRPAAPAAALRMSGEAAWRLLTGAPYDERAVEASGDPALARPLLDVRGIIV